MRNSFLSVKGKWRIANCLLLMVMVTIGCSRKITENGMASFYGAGDGYHGRKTANGEIFNKNKLTAAHKTIPFGTVVKVKNLSNGKTIKVRINDRGP
ncbi:MAG: septal ring lytic transglycosylase RlpA family protein, partial [Sediminibacterium sp.]